MKLNRVTKNDPPNRLAVTIVKSVLAQLERYAQFYKAVHGDEIPQSLLVQEMLRSFMGEDKDFQAWLKKPGDEAPKSGKSESAARTKVPQQEELAALEPSEPPVQG